MARPRHPTGFEKRETQILASVLYADAELLVQARVLVSTKNGHAAAAALRRFVTETLQGDDMHEDGLAAALLEAFLEGVGWTELALQLKADGSTKR